MFCLPVHVLSLVLISFLNYFITLTLIYVYYVTILFFINLNKFIGHLFVKCVPCTFLVFCHTVTLFLLTLQGFYIDIMNPSSTLMMGTDLMGELRAFIAGATKNARKGHLDIGLARVALSLLKTLPASREAVLEYFCSLFDEVVGRYIENLEVRYQLILSLAL